MPINIPSTLVVRRDTASEAELLEAGRAWLTKEERAAGVHASDLLDPLQAYWRNKKPLPLADRDVCMFLVGKVLHAFVLGSIEGKVDLGITDAGSSYSKVLDLTYSPDMMKGGVPRELKTTRSFYEPKTVDDLGLYIEQLLVYMSSTNSCEGKLWVLYLNLKNEAGRTQPAFRCFTITLSTEELARVTGDLVAQRALLAQALETNDPRVLSLCREWKCGAANCQWYEDCKPEGRYHSPKYDLPAEGSRRASGTKRKPKQ